MIPVQPTLISQPFANGGEKNVIPNSGGEVLGNASYASGFPRITETPIELGGVPPQRKDFNGILNALSSFNFFQQSGGVFAYSNTLNYIPGCVVRYNNTEFVCITENGVDSVNGVHSPADATYWKKHTHPFIGINSTGINAVNFNGGGATGADAIAIGKGTVSRASASVAVGSAALGDGTHSVAIGYGAQAKPQDSVAIGNTAIVATNGVNSVAIGRGAVAESSLVVSVGNGNQNRKIVNMADGTDAKDAVNVSQLNAATTPIGTIIMWASSTNPQDGGVWLDCNGQSCTAYPKLVAIVGNNVPNLRGLFPRCVGSQTLDVTINGTTTSQTFSGGTVGSKAADTIRNITGYFGGNEAGSGYPTGGAFYSQEGSYRGVDGSDTDNARFKFDASRVVPVGVENKPVSVALRFLIKAQ